MICDIQSLPKGIPVDLPTGEVVISCTKRKEADNDIGTFGFRRSNFFHKQRKNNDIVPHKAPQGVSLQAPKGWSSYVHQKRKKNSDIGSPKASQMLLPLISERVA